MGVEDTSSGQVFEKLVEMGFESSAAADAIKEVGASLNCAIEFLLKDTQGNNIEASSSSNYSSRSGRALGKKEFALSHPSRKLRQCSILEALPPTKGTKKSRTNFGHEVSNSGSEVLPSALQEPKDHGPFQVPKEPLFVSGCNLGIASDSSIMAVHFPEGLQTGVDWEQMANQLLQKHFGYSSLKGFQKEALAAWLAHEDCLVLAATGSGKSLCFQIPALLSGKVVVVISPLISLMHDQCLKLARHGVSACFLGSGQPDSGVEHRAMSGKYGLIYLCPETLVRLIKPLQRLAESRGIALFAIDEVHCVSKWGHDFRTEYRRLSALRENFSVGNLNFLKYDIPIMALTATATTFVQEDILMSLKMSKKTKMVLTSFFRPNLRFAVKHSRTSSRSSYEKDFAELIDVYARGRKTDGKRCSITWQDRKEVSGDSSSIANDSRLELDEVSMGGGERIEDSYFDRYNNANSSQEKCSRNSKRKQLTVEYLEDEVDNFQSVDDWDVACGEFCGKSPAENKNVCGSPSTLNPPVTLEDEAAFPQGLLEDGPTIIYVPTRKETQSIADYLCRIGVKAAAYNAKLAKSHLRRVHKEFHENSLEVVVATIAFGMGIDKSNVRRIIHYGWPQSLEAYYQEAGRAGRDGRLADCVLYANLLRVPTLLPCRRSEEQNKQAYKMLADCYRYGMKTSYCRARLLVEYFGEDFKHEKCLLCDVCVSGHQKVENLKEEADILLEAIASTNEQSSYVELDGFHGEIVHSGQQRSSREKLNMRAFASRIREQFHKFATIDHRWWQGLARILEDTGYIKEGDDKPHVQIKFPELTEMGRSFLQSKREQTFLAHPEADMVLLMEESRGPFSSFAEWGKGWADPEIRRRRLGAKQRTGRRQRRRRPRKNRPPTKTGRERLKAKLAKCK